MRTVVVLLLGLTATCASFNIDDKIMWEYGRVAIMRNCFGERIFKQYVAKVRAAVAACRAKAVQLQRTPPADRGLGSEKQDILFDSKHVHELSVKMRLAISNSTCVLQQLGYIDDKYEIQYEKMKQEVKEVGRFDKRLMADLIKSINQCGDFVTCYSDDHHIQYPISATEMKYVIFSNCRNTGTIVACLKKQFRDEQPDYDHSAAHNTVDTADVDEKMISFLWGSTNTGIF